MHSLERDGRLAAQALQPILQQEHPHQTPGGLGGEQPRDRVCFGVECCAAAGAIAHPQVDDGVGRRIMLASCLPRHARFERTAHELSHAGEAEQAIRQWRLPWRRSLDQDRSCRALELGRGDQAVDQAALQGAIGAPRFAREHQFHRLADAEQAHRAHRAAESRVYAELHLRQAQGQAAVIDRDAIAARQGQLEPATEREAGDCGDRRAGERGQLVENPLSNADVFVALGGAAKGGELAYVRSGDEARGFTGAHDHALGRRRLEFAQQGLKFEQNRLAECIGAAARPINDQAGDAIAVTFQSPGAVGVHTVAFIACESQNRRPADGGPSGALPGCEIP